MNAKTVLTIFAVIEILALIFWQVADVFSGFFANFLHSLSVCGFLAGAAYALNKALKRPKLIWISAAVLSMLISLLLYGNFHTPTALHDFSIRTTWFQNEAAIMRYVDDNGQLFPF